MAYYWIEGRVVWLDFATSDFWDLYATRIQTRSQKSKDKIIYYVKSTNSRFLQTNIPQFTQNLILTTRNTLNHET